MSKIKQGAYKHFRGGIYTVLFEAIRVDRQADKMDVVYVSAKTGDIYTRDKEEFLGQVMDDDGQAVPRFTPVE